AARLDLAPNGHDLGEQDLSGRLAALAQHGFDAVEIVNAKGAAAAELAESLRANGLTPVTLEITADGALLLSPTRTREFREALGAAFTRARAIGCWHLSCPIGAAPRGLPIEDALDIAVENLRYAAKAAAASGLRVLLEPVAT